MEEFLKCGDYKEGLARRYAFIVHLFTQKARTQLSLGDGLFATSDVPVAESVLPSHFLFSNPGLHPDLLHSLAIEDEGGIAL